MQTNLWTLMWFNPRKAIQIIVATNPHHHVLLLTVLSGISQTLGNAEASGLGDLIPVNQLIFMCITIGPLGGIVTLYLLTFLIHYTSHKIGGVAEKQEIRAAIAWSWVPIVTLMPLWLVKYILFRNELFSNEKTYIQSQPVLANLYSILNFVDFVIAIWSLVLLYINISQVNQFSTVKGFLSVLLSSLIIGIPAFLIMLLLFPAF